MESSSVPTLCLLQFEGSRRTYHTLLVRPTLRTEISGSSDSIFRGGDNKHQVQILCTLHLEPCKSSSGPTGINGNLNLAMLAASFVGTHKCSDGNVHSAATCLTGGGCFLSGVTLTSTSLPLSPIIDRHFVGGALLKPLIRSSDSSFTFFLVA